MHMCKLIEPIGDQNSSEILYIFSSYINKFQIHANLLILTKQINHEQPTLKQLTANDQQEITNSIYVEQNYW